MKLAGMAGKGTGRVGSMVYAVRKGEQIVRQYNPNVANPNTPAQVAQRAKFKLLSQLSSIVAEGLLLKSEGAINPRNRFMALNLPAVSYDETSTRAIVNYEEMRISDGRTPITAVRTDSTEGVNVEVGGDWDGIAVAVLTSPTVGGVFGFSQIFDEKNVTIPVATSLQSRTTILVAAYRYTTEGAKAKYASMTQGQSAKELQLPVEVMINEGAIETSLTVVAAA